MSTRTHPACSKIEMLKSLNIFDRILKSASIVSIFKEVLRIFQRYCVNDIARDIRMAIPKAVERRIDMVETYVCDLAVSVAQFKSPEHDAALFLPASLPSRYWKSKRCDVANPKAMKGS